MSIISDTIQTLKDERVRRCDPIDKAIAALEAIEPPETPAKRPYTKKIKPKERLPQDLSLKCAFCADRFPTARGRGIHETKKHYGEKSAAGSSLGNL